jgi:hypothetical protein
MLELCLDCGLVLGTYAVIAAVTAWAVCAIVHDYSRACSTSLGE